MKRAIILAIAMFTSACSDRGEAENAVKAMLVDPDSAKFGDFTKSDDGKFACLSMNAKNRMGGYNGEEQVMFNIKDGKWSYMTKFGAPHETCVADINKADFWGRAGS